MNGAEFTRAARALADALIAAGIRVERADQVRGRLLYETIEPEALLGRIMHLGWRVTFVEPPKMPLHLHREDGPEL